MDTQQMAARRTELLRKRWGGEITSEEQDELDNLTQALRLLAAGLLPRLRVVGGGDPEA